MRERTRLTYLFIKNTLGWAAALSAIFLVSTIGWAYVDMKFSRPPMETIGPTNVLTPTVPRGGILRIERRIKRNYFCPGRVSRYHLDSMRTPHLAESYDFPLPAPEEARRQLDAPSFNLKVEVPTPLAMASGKAYYQSTVRYYCNFLQRLLDKPTEVVSPVVEYIVEEEQTRDIRPSRRNTPGTKDFPAIQNRPFEAP